MKIKYLGTAAAEGIPALYCHCALCEKAWKLGGKDVRTRSQSIVDNRLLLDFPPDTYAHLLAHHFDLAGVRHLLVTHSHSDHFYPLDLAMRCQPFSYPADEVMTVYGNPAVEKLFYDQVSPEPRAMEHLHFVPAKPFEELKVDAYRVTPLLANHDKEEQCLIYLIDDGEKTLLYAHDTGLFPEATWEFLKGRKLDLVSLDCTSMQFTDGDYHMGLPNDIKAKERLERMGCVKPKTVFVVNHFSHNGRWTHIEMEEHASAAGFLTSFDGMEIVF